MQENGGQNNQGLDSKKQLQTLESQVTSQNLPKNVSMQLYSLMTKVVEDDLNPKTVSAACQCASEIHKILKLNHDMSKRR